MLHSSIDVNLSLTMEEGVSVIKSYVIEFHHNTSQLQTQIDKKLYIYLNMKYRTFSSSNKYY